MGCGGPSTGCVRTQAPETGAAELRRAQAEAGPRGRGGVRPAAALSHLAGGGGDGGGRVPLQLAGAAAPGRTRAVARARSWCRLSHRHPHLPLERARPRARPAGRPVDGGGSVGPARRRRRDGLDRGPGCRRTAAALERAQGLGRVHRVRRLRRARGRAAVRLDPRDAAERGRVALDSRRGGTGDRALLTFFFGDPTLARRAGLGLAINVAIAALAYALKSIDVAGALSAVVIGTLITAGLGLRGLAVMIAFFVVGTAVTKLGYRVKAQRGIAQEKGGARGWRNAWANGGVPAALALLAGFSAPDDRYLFALAYAAAVATAGADTCSSEVGKAYGRHTYLITTLRPVPPGTEGAISAEGTFAGLAGAIVVAAVGAAGGLYGPGAAALVAIAGLLGSLAESVLGTVAEERGWLDNDLLNAVNTAIGAALVLLMARAAA
ncbi:MAG: hypothetical protein DMF77_08615 [Acidobacteria bacterium]|nr:MAG: hypothetical protein DMF77_08615 [Acidobacteriota bacterium]